MDLFTDLNQQDDDGYGWALLGEARDPSEVRPGAVLVAGNEAARASVRVLSVDPDGQVHFEILPPDAV